MDIDTIVWIVFVVVLLIVEAATYGLVSIWFAIGAMCAAVASGFGIGTVGQMVVFAAVSTVVLIATRPLVKKMQLTVHETVGSAKRIIGEDANVTVAIDPIEGVGQIKVGGEVWSAKTEDESKIEEGARVRIIDLQGVKAIVKLI